MISFNIEITISRLVALIMIILGFILSYRLALPSPFEVACTSAGVVIAVKTGMVYWGEARRRKCSKKVRHENDS